MAVNVTEEFNLIPEILTEIAILQKSTLLIGVFGEEDSEILLKARVNEYGAQITVTEKMRAYLRGQGFGISDNLGTINIPERSFLRSTFDSKKKKFESNIEKDFSHLLQGNLSAKGLLDKNGLKIQRAVQEQIESITSPPNHPFTVEQKSTSAGAGDKPLEDTGQLKNEGIEYKVVVN